MNDRHKATLRRFIGFSLCNTPGFLIEMLVLWLCSTYIFHHYAGIYIISPFIAFECAVIANFSCFSLFVWHDRISGLRFRGRLVRLLAYNLSALGVYLLRLGIIQLLGLLWQLPVLLCDLLSLCFSGIINYVINDKVIFSNHRKHRLWVGTLITLAYPWIHLRLKGRENIPTADSHASPVVYVCNHGFISGPVMAAINLPVTFRPWVDSLMLNRESCYQNLYDTFARTLPVGKRLRHAIITLMRNIVIAILNDFKPIPVARDGSRQIVETLKQSVDTLTKGTNLLIFPEHPRQNYKGHPHTERQKADNELRSFYSGFAHIGELYHKQTGKTLTFIPLYIDRKRRVMHISGGIAYHPTDNPRNDRIAFSNSLFDIMSQLATQFGNATT